MSSTSLVSSSIRHRTPQRQAQAAETGVSSRAEMSSPSRKSSIESITKSSTKERHLRFPFLNTVTIRRTPSQTSIGRPDHKDSDEPLLKVITREQARLQERIKSLEQDNEGLRALYNAEREERTQLSHTHRSDNEALRLEMWNEQREIESAKKEISQLQRLVDDLTTRLSNKEREFETYKNGVERLDRESVVAKAEERKRMDMTERLYDVVKRTEGQGESLQNHLSSLEARCTDIKSDIQEVKDWTEERFGEIGRSRDNQEHAVTEVKALIRSLEDRISSCGATLRALRITSRDHHARLDAAVVDMHRLRAEMDKRISEHVQRSFLLLAIAVMVFAASKFLGIGQPSGIALGQASPSPPHVLT